MIETDLQVPTVEIAHLAAQHADDAERQSRFSEIGELEVDQAWKELFERIDGIPGSLLDADCRLRRPHGRNVGRIEAGYPGQSGGEAGRHTSDFPRDHAPRRPRPAFDERTERPPARPAR